MKVVVGLLLAVAALASEPRKYYEGYKVYRIHTHTKQQALQLNDLALDDVRLDFWVEPNRVGIDVDIFISPEDQEEMENYFRENGMEATVVRENIDKDLREMYERLDDQFEYDPNDYNTYENIMIETDAMAERCPDEVQCETYSIGESTFGNDLKVLKITTEGTGKKAIWVDSLIHAREWLAGATMMRIFDRLTRNYTVDAEVRNMLDNFDWYYEPVVNPDGYIYTFETERMWRKSRNFNEGSTCRGVDLNRNYVYMWNNGGASSNPCSDSYMGASAASEVETQHLIDEAIQLRGDAILFATIHTFGNMLLVPFGFLDDEEECTRADEWDDLMQVINATCEAIEATHDTTWRCGNACDILYQTSGTSRDWGRGSLEAKYVFTGELRGEWFDPPPSEIEPSFEEFWNGFVALIHEIQEVEGMNK